MDCQTPFLKFIFSRAFPLFGMLVIFQSCTPGDKKNTSNSTDSSEIKSAQLLEKAKQYFQPLPEVAENKENPVTSEKVKLGKMLYYDTRLSKNGNNSCNSCHNIEKFGVDNEITSEGDAGKRGGRNSPTVFNAALHFAQFWDGRAKDVEEQAGMPVLNPIEMAIPHEGFLVDRLGKISEYQSAFKAAFPLDEKPVTYQNLRNAIGAFERTLITPTRFDNFLKGDTKALSDDEKKGLETFMNVGCTNCHIGPAIGGNMFQKFGLFKDYRLFTKSKTEDTGRMMVTKSEVDKDQFKVPSLRNIEKTAPYFHDGSVADLREVISIMGSIQLNKKLSDAEITSIKTFLQSLTGEIKPEWKQKLQASNK